MDIPTPKMPTPIKDSLICTDFDGTYTLSNTQVIILEVLGLDRVPLDELPRMLDTLESLWQLHKDACFKAIRTRVNINEKSKGAWANAVKKLAEEGFYHVIVSFNIFGEALIPWFFREMLGLSDTFVRENIGVVSFWPKGGVNDNKNLHLEKAVELAKEKLKINPNIQKNRVVFGDDNYRNCTAANEAGYLLTVFVTPRGDHVERLSRHCEQLLQKENHTLFSSSGSDKSPRTGSTTPLKDSFENIILLEHMEGRASPRIK